MIVVIAPEKILDNEFEILHQLFESGLQYFHLRKPNEDINRYRAYLNKVDMQYHNRIVLHQYHELTEEFNLKGIHLQEQPRIDLQGKLVHYVEEHKSKGLTVSSSFHEPEVLEACEVIFDYHLLSPVFNAISKQGYEGRGFDVNHIDRTIVGMGGVNENTVAETIQLGFKGIGVLGGVWNSETPIDSFKAMKNVFQKVING